MRSKTVKAAAAAALLAVAGLAGATTVTFDSLTNPGAWQYVSPTYTESGFSFASTKQDYYSLYSYGLDSPYNADPTGATLSENDDGQGLVVSRVGGGTFTLGSFDLAFNPEDNNPGLVRFDYTDATGLHSTTLSFSDAFKLHTFVFNDADVTSFTLWNDDFQLDNVKFDTVVPAVPEPASCALLLAGLVGMASIARRRKA